MVDNWGSDRPPSPLATDIRQGGQHESERHGNDARLQPAATIIGINAEDHLDPVRPDECHNKYGSTRHREGQLEPEARP